MPLDGLRAWIGEVERKLGMRTRVFLVLATIAIGGAGAAIYLAIDTREDAVSESDVRALQERLEAQMTTEAARAPEPAPQSDTKPEAKPRSDSSSGADKAKLQELLEQAKKTERSGRSRIRQLAFYSAR